MVDTMVAEETDKVYVLNAKDRCDSCPAQALVWVNGINGDLQFCGHHYAKNEKALASWAFEVVDERDKINAKSESSA